VFFWYVFLLVEFEFQYSVVKFVVGAYGQWRLLMQTIFACYLLYFLRRFYYLTLISCVIMYIWKNDYKQKYHHEQSILP
jgi:hypothetical protein